MATLTDPARELGEIAIRLSTSGNDTGEKYLARQFGVAVWSTNFVKIIGCILDRADLVGRIISRSDLDEDHKESALHDLASFKAGFTGASLRKAWNEAGSGLTAMKDHGRPLQYLSPEVRKQVSYPKLSPEEVGEFLGLIDVYLQELEKSTEGPAFVRQAVIDGLSTFRFQLAQIGWMGSGYALAAFREVIFIYDASRREFTSSGNPDAEAFMAGFLGIITSFKKKIDEAQGWKDTADSVWKGYMLASTVATPLLLAGHFPALPAG